MKKLLVLLAVIISVLGATTGTAKATFVIAHLSGLGHEYGGSNCGSDCLAVGYGRAYNTSSQASVGSVHTCGGYTYNFGAGDTGCPVASSTDLVVTVPYNSGSYIDVWLRHGCPSGYYYSPTKTVFVYPQITETWVNFGTLTLNTPTHCFAASPLLSNEMTRVLGMTTSN